MNSGVLPGGVYVVGSVRCSEMRGVAWRHFFVVGFVGGWSLL